MVNINTCCIFAHGTKKQMKGTEAFPSSFIMTAETQIQTIGQLLQPLLVDDIFLVSIKIKPTNNYKVYIDADSGLGIEKCTRINRALYKQIEEAGLHPDGNFSLEVSSPGLDEPLRQYRQYVKNVGRNVDVVLLDGRKIEGKLTEVAEDAITIEEDRNKRPDGRPSGKKKEPVTHVLLFSDIKSTTVQIKF